jgi:ParB/RepB/Spo0J family partition protein
MPPTPPPPRDATRPGETEIIVYINLSDLHPFKEHPFQIHDDDEMKALVESVKERGVDQPAIVRPREGGGYELVAGHRRKHAAELAGYINVPCVVRNMNDDEAILTMTESNFNQRSEILPSERAKALKMQLDAIKRQGVKSGDVSKGEIGKRSNEIIAERNKMSVKNVQRYIALNKLVPDLLKSVDDKKMKFTVAVEMSYIRPKNQQYIAVAMAAQESAPSGAQAQRMRELDQKGILNGDVIDGIMVEEKKEEIRVIINSQELAKYFGPEKSPLEMKETILKLLDEYKEKQPLEYSRAAKLSVHEK